MTEIRTYDTAELVAEAAAENAVEILNLAITEKGQATWVLAGGSSPMVAYKVLVKRYADAVDWTKVTVIMGDERFVSHDHKDSNWGAIMRIFDKNDALLGLHKVTPDILANVASTAEAYDSKLAMLTIDRFDLVWVGVGEDGHTLSLFPGNSAFVDAPEKWILPVYESPKPPSERISLSLKALEHVSELVVFATGATKQSILKEARLKGGLPIAVAAEIAEQNGAEVRWLYDDGAWGER